MLMTVTGVTLNIILSDELNGRLDNHSRQQDEEDLLDRIEKQRGMCEDIHICR